MPLHILTFNWHEPYIYLLAKTGHQFDDEMAVCRNIDDLLQVKNIEIPKILIFHNKLSTEIKLGGNSINKQDYIKQVKMLIRQSEPIRLVFISETKKMDWGEGVCNANE